MRPCNKPRKAVKVKRLRGRLMQGKTALITGSTSGIGLGIAKALAAAGANIMLNGLGDATTIEQVRQSLAREHNVKVSYHGADMREPAQIAELASACHEELGSLDVVVNNAGVQFTAPIEEF